MEFKQGFVYHISNEYFELVNDPYLMQNKENGNLRPTYFCMKDDLTSLLWVVPMSTRIEKYQAIANKQIEKHGSSITIVIGDYVGRKNAFLLQNLFPITEKYLHHVHTINGAQVPVSYKTRQEIATKMKRILLLHEKGTKLIFPDIKRLKMLMLSELAEMSIVNPQSSLLNSRQSIIAQIAEAKEESLKRASNRADTQPPKKSRELTD